MYVKPELRQFGTLRDLTLYGVWGDCDGGAYGSYGNSNDRS